jgi:CRISPR system Cascade subunit CasE
MDWALKAAADSALESWLKEKGARNGFELVHGESMNGKKRLKFQAEGYRWHAMPKKGRDAGFSSVDFEGELQVVDPELFQTMLFNGIGPAKAFGCGLMMVRRT